MERGGAAKQGKTLCKAMQSVCTELVAINKARAQIQFNLFAYILSGTAMIWWTTPENPAFSI